MRSYTRRTQRKTSSYLAEFSTSFSVATCLRQLNFLLVFLASVIQSDLSKWIPLNWITRLVDILWPVPFCLQLKHREISSL